MSGQWFTSDLHLGDDWPARMRFGTVNAAYHEAWLGDSWDEVVGLDDDVWVLGDVAVGWNLEQVKAWLDARPGYKHLVVGNWDEDVTLRDWRERGGFTTAHHPGILLYLDHLTVGLSHAPRPVNNPGALVRATLHGHTHRKAQRAHRDAKGRLLIHVGWDAWRGPVSWERVKEYIEAQREEQGS